MNFIGISDDKMKHILSVARQCQKIAKDKYNLNDYFCQKAFLIGYLHDIGYEFSTNNSDHPKVGYEMLRQILDLDITEIRDHGNPNTEQSLFLDILNEADLTVNSKGKIVTPEERLEDIKERYGVASEQYMNALTLAKKIKLLI